MACFRLPLFDRFLYFFVPFYVLRYESLLDGLSAKVLGDELQAVWDSLHGALKDVDPGLVLDISRLMATVNDHVLRKHNDLRKKAGRV